MKWLGILFMAALLASAPGYGWAQQQKDTSPATRPQAPAVKGETVGTATSFSPAARKAYEQQTAEELAAIQQKIADLRMQAAAGSPQKKRLLIQASKNLQLQQVGAATELATLKKASDTAWGPQKVKVDKAMEGLRKAFEPNSPPGK
jgi:hypothetical protein